MKTYIGPARSVYSYDATNEQIIQGSKESGHRMRVIVYAGGSTVSRIEYDNGVNSPWRNHGTVSEGVLNRLLEGFELCE